MNPTSLPAQPSPQQIVYHQQAHGRLYGEMIQVVPERNRCWVRPLAYVATPNPMECSSPWGGPSATVQDLRCGPDIICSLGTFHPAFDQDWLAIAPLLWPGEVMETVSNHSKCDRAAAQARLQGILRDITER